MNGKRKMDEKTDGFKFAITLLATIGTILYGSYNYFQIMPVEFYNYALVAGIIAVLMVLSLFLIFYILIKGFSMEIQDAKLKNAFEKYASYVYLLSFFTSMMTFIFIVGSFALLPITEYALYIMLLIIIVLFICIIYLSRGYVKKRFKSGHFPFLISLVFICFIVGLILWAVLYPVVSDSPLQGHITVEMENVYYKNGSIIPISIQVTGLDTGVNIFLYNEDMGSIIGPIDDIHLKSKHNLTDIAIGLDSTLIGNKMDNGRYSIFIKTDNLTEGYYKLLISSMGIDNKRSINTFFLISNID